MSSPVDYSVICIYITGIFILAFYSGKLKKNGKLAENQYLAGKSLTTFESMSSIIATEVSALTFLGIPAYAFASDFSFIQIYFGATIGRIVIAFIMLPKMYDKGITIYSVMGLETESKDGQRIVSVFYSISKFLAVGVRLFSGSILVAEFFNLNIYFAISLICALTFFYTLIGGLKAVVRTDIIQMALFISGGIAAHIIIPQVAGVTWSEMMNPAYTAGKTSFIDFNNLSSFFIGFMGGVLFDMSTHGVDQDFVQRLTANKTLRGAKIAIVSSSFISIAVGALFLSIGALLWSYYQSHTAPKISNDRLFAHFITMYFPEGLKGLMVAGVLAATMSTLDSTINALSSCFHTDIFRHQTKTNKEIATLYRRDTLFITLGLLGVAFFASTSSSLLILGLKVASWTAGSLLCLFFLTTVFKVIKLSTKNVLIAYGLGIIAVYLNTFHFKLNWNLNVYLGFSFSLIGLLLAKKWPSNN